MKKGVVISVVVLLMSATGCSRITDGADEALLVDLVGVEWVLISFQQANGVQKDVGSQGMVLTFLEGGRLEGLLFSLADPEAEGNEYFATYEADEEGSLSISPPQFRDHPGFFPHGSRWFEYHRALINATSYEIVQERLRIVYDRSWVLNYSANAAVTDGDE